MELHGERIVDVNFSGASDQPLGEVVVNATVPHLVSVSQRVAADWPANPHVIELPASGSQTGFDIS